MVSVNRAFGSFMHLHFSILVSIFQNGQIRYEIWCMWDKFFDFFIEPIGRFGFPTVLIYHCMVGNVFLNVAATDAQGLEKAGDTFLIPFQYLFAGRNATFKVGNSQADMGEWEFVQRFDYHEMFWPKTLASIALLPSSLTFGALTKALAYYHTSYFSRHASIFKSLNSKKVVSQLEQYRKMGIDIVRSEDMELLEPEGYERRPGDELYLSKEKQALKEIGDLLNRNEILWWVDCGTCLGTYRYGGTIPWDYDIDIAVLLPDFENVFHALTQLDPGKYVVLDWSSREHPKSYIKIYVKESDTLIDIYHFAILEKERQIQYLLSLENNLFLPKSWQIREKRFTIPIAFEDVFPLKKSILDGVCVFVPKNTKKYLQRYYGENLSPAKIYNPETGLYEKDLSHSYWQRVHAH